MQVKLISHSTAPVDTGLDNLQELIAFSAKVSNPNNQINKETSEKLIKYLIKHQHWSPLEMVSACLEIETTTSHAIAFSFPISPNFSTVLPLRFIKFLSKFNKLDKDFNILSRYFDTLGCSQIRFISKLLI